MTPTSIDMTFRESPAQLSAAIAAVLRTHFPDPAPFAVALPASGLHFENGAACNVIVEAVDFCDREDGAALAADISLAAHLGPVQLSFVPPRFLCRNAAGGIDQPASLIAWQLHERAAENLSAPVRGTGEAGSGSVPARNVIRIVSLADLRTVVLVRERQRRQLAQKLRAEIVWEHVCLPPSPILLSDLIFHDYFQPRLEQEPFAAVTAAFAKLRAADVIVVDDGAEMLIGARQFFGALSHAMQRDHVADLIAVRTQKYAAHHHELPLTVVAGLDLRLMDRTVVLDRLSRYLGKPIFRIGGIEPFSRFTEGWDYRPLTAMSAGGKGSRELEPDALVDALAAWIGERNIVPSQSVEPAVMIVADHGHYCSHLTRKEDIDKLLPVFERYCIAGQPSSVPYIATELARVGKSFAVVPGFEPEMLSSVAPYDCLLICGAQGPYPITTPAAAIMKSTPAWRTFRLQAPDLAKLSFTVAHEEFPPSNTDWCYAHPLDRSMYESDYAPTIKFRNRAVAEAKRERAHRRELRQARSATEPVSTETPAPRPRAERAGAEAPRLRPDAVERGAQTNAEGVGTDQAARREQRRQAAEQRRAERVAARRAWLTERRRDAAPAATPRRAAE